ncbi:MAG: metallophosphoesterase [Clostridia bacterium]|nr:metallophosphoesterase [Clostridia bacterium]
MITSCYSVASQKINGRLKAAFISDLHNCKKASHTALDIIADKKPDIILFSGDAVNRITGKYDVALDFLEKASKIAPVFYSLGNHDLAEGTEGFREGAKKRGVILLDNEYTAFKGIFIGGLSFIKEAEHENIKEKRESFLDEFSSLDGFKLLLSHVPRYYNEFLRQKDIDLILSGHSHGGQIGFGKRGVYSPDQGFFPKYVGGFYENRLIVTRGLGQTAHLPRFFNPYEVVFTDFN